MAELEVLKVKRNKNYSTISSIGVNDENLSWKAKGILWYILSRPDNWKIRKNDLLKKAKSAGTSLKTGLNELIDNKYLFRFKFKVPSSGQFSWMYLGFEEPYTDDILRDFLVELGFDPEYHFPCMDFREMENNPHSNNNYSKLNEFNKEQYSSKEEYKETSQSSVSSGADDCQFEQEDNCDCNKGRFLEPNIIESFGEEGIYGVRDMLINEGYLQYGDSEQKVYQFIKKPCTCKKMILVEVETKPNIEVKQQVNDCGKEVDLKQITKKMFKKDNLPKVLSNGASAAATDIHNYWCDKGFKGSLDYVGKITEEINLLLNGNFLIKKNIGDSVRKFTVSEIKKAIDTRASIQKGKTKKFTKPLWMWLWYDDKKSSQFLYDLVHEYSDLPKDSYPELTNAIKQEYNKSICNGISSCKWTLTQEKQFISASKQLKKYLAEFRKHIKSHYNCNDKQVAGWIVKSILWSTNDVVANVHPGWLSSKVMFNSTLPKYLNDQAVSDGKLPVEEKK